MEVPKGSYSCIPSEKNSMLINEVRKFPALYDTSDPNYYVLAERNKAWLKVAENCDVPAEHCHLRWKSLRKRYAKERRKFKEILQGQRRPWALFPKMSFLASSAVKGRISSKSRKKVSQKKIASAPVENFKQTVSDDDMLILDDNDEIVHTCKTAQMPDEDEYIYEHLDDPDSALEIMKGQPNPTEKQTAIRSGTCSRAPIGTRIGGSGRIRKLTPKMQNSIIAKKLKQAQQILQQSNATDVKSTSLLRPEINATTNKRPVEIKSGSENSVLNQDRTRHVAKVNPNVVRGGQITDKDESVSNPQESPSEETTINKVEPGSSEKRWAVKVIKLKGRNPIIFSPEELPKYQSFLKAEHSPTKELSEIAANPPLIKVKSVENLNNNSVNDSSLPINNNNNNNDGNLDIIHSVGLMRKQSKEKTTTAVEKFSQQSYARAYSWNRPCSRKTDNQTLPEVTEKTQPDSQTRDYEIEEAWNDIKEENIDDDEYWSNYQDNVENNQVSDGLVNTDTPTKKTAEMWNKLSEAKLELVLYQRKLLEEQHQKNLEYMKKEHELKMTLLRAEIDLKRKQLNIML